MSESDGRKAGLLRLAGVLSAIEKPHPIRVAIDGRSAAGKTTLANELAGLLRDQGHEAIRVSVDDFHRPPEVRYVRGQMSPEGYYLDTYDYDLVRTRLLKPLGPGGSLRYVAASSDLRKDEPLPLVEHVAPPNAIALIDGVFLFRPELNACWDYRIFVDADIEETLRRAQERDVAWMGSREDVLLRYRRRYVPGEDMYIAAINPRSLADVVIENTDPSAPVLTIA
jgi:uridine kinase